jgi:hypothetical protein
MKIRHGFVSNSSTCSFQIYGIQIEEPNIRVILDSKREETDKFLKEENKRIATYIKDFKPYKDLEEYLDNNGYYVLLSVVFPEIRVLSGEREFFFGEDPANMDNDETMGEFKKRISDAAKQFFGESTSCSFIKREYRC